MYEEQELTFHPKQIAKVQTRTKRSIKNHSRSPEKLYEDMVRYKHLKNNKILEKLEEKDKEIEKLKQQLIKQKLYQKRHSTDPFARSKGLKRDNLLHQPRSS